MRSASAGVGWVATPTLRFDLTAGYGRDRPDLRRSRNESKWVQAGVSAALPKGFTVGGGGVRWTDFEGPCPPHPGRRAPRGQELQPAALGLQPRPHVLRLQPGSVRDPSVIHEIRETNAQLYDYKRTSGELRVVRRF